MKKMKKKIIQNLSSFLIIFVLQITSMSVYSQDLKFEHLEDSYELKFNTVVKIIQDSTGLLWFATNNGLLRYNGYEFKIFNKKKYKNLKSHVIPTIFEDSKRRLLIGTRKGLYCYNYQYDRFKLIFKNKNKRITLVNTIFEDNKNRIWIGTYSGIFILDKNDKLIKSYIYNKDDSNSILHNTIGKISRDSNNKTWILTLNGLSMYNNKNSFINYPLPQDNKTKRIWATTSYLNSDDEIWIAAKNKGLMKFDIKKLKYNSYKDNFIGAENLKNNLIYDIFQDSNTLWISSIKGLIHFDVKTNEWEIIKNDHNITTSISQNDVRYSFKDRNNNFWVCTLGGGINKISKNSLYFSNIKAGNKKNNLNNKMVWSIYKDKSDNILYGTDDGLNFWDKKEGRFYYYKDNSANSDFNDDFFMSIFEDHNSNIWIGTSGKGLKKFDRKTKTFTTFKRSVKDKKSLSSNVITKLYQDKEKNLWIGTSFGLNRYNYKNNEFAKTKKNKNFPLAHLFPVLDIIEKNSNELYIGTRRGFFEFDKKKNILQKNTIFSSIDTIVSVILRDNGFLWLGTNSGLYRLNMKLKTLIKYNKQDGLSDASIRSIIKTDKNTLWISTDFGLSKFNIQKESFTNYYKNNGISGNRFNARASIKARDGKLYFGGLNGVTSFYPENIIEDTIVPNIIITDFKLFNKDVNIGENSILKTTIQYTKKINLKYNQNFFSFEFAALDFTNPKKNKYKYKLSGIDKDWVFSDAGRRFANYSGVAPGNYTFTVKGSNSNGVWNNKGVSINIYIETPFWNTWWFRLFLALFTVIIIIFLYKKRIKNIELKLRSENAVNELCINYKITNREKEILNLILTGKDNKEIEDILFISYNTVKNHVHNIFTKFEVKSRSDLVLFFNSTQNIDKKN